MKKKIAILEGDGIGPEVTREAIKILKAVSSKFELKLEFQEYLAGGASIEKHGVPIPDEVLQNCKQANAVLLGAIGGAKWDDLPKDSRPEVGLLKLRKELGLFTNLRPIKIHQSLINASTLKPETIQGVDILIVRELTGGIYFGQPRFTESTGQEERAVDTMEYRTSEIERITHVAFQAAKSRRKKVTSVDKANILATSQLWRKTVSRLAEDYSDVTLEHMLVDNCAMQLVRNPLQFDVILTENLFGDILSDEAAMLTGSIGMLPSASLGKGVGLYEPVHGSAPEITGKNIANPLAAIGSVALMFRHSFHLEKAANTIEQALARVLKQGYRCSDIFHEGQKLVGTIEMGNEVVNDIIELKI